MSLPSSPNPARSVAPSQHGTRGAVLPLLPFSTSSHSWLWQQSLTVGSNMDCFQHRLTGIQKTDDCPSISAFCWMQIPPGAAHSFASAIFCFGLACPCLFTVAVASLIRATGSRDSFLKVSKCPEKQKISLHVRLCIEVLIIFKNLNSKASVSEISFILEFQLSSRRDPSKEQWRREGISCTYVWVLLTQRDCKCYRRYILKIKKINRKKTLQNICFLKNSYFKLSSAILWIFLRSN